MITVDNKEYKKKLKKLEDDLMKEKSNLVMKMKRDTGDGKINIKLEQEMKETK